MKQLYHYQPDPFVEKFERCVRENVDEVVRGDGMFRKTRAQLRRPLDPSRVVDAMQQRLEFPEERIAEVNAMPKPIDWDTYEDMKMFLQMCGVARRLHDRRHYDYLFRYYADGYRVAVHFSALGSPSPADKTTVVRRYETFLNVRIERCHARYAFIFSFYEVEGEDT